MSLPLGQNSFTLCASHATVCDCLRFLATRLGERLVCAETITRLALRRRSNDQVEVVVSINDQTTVDGSFCEVLKIGVLRDQDGELHMLIKHDARFEEQRLHLPAATVAARLTTGMPDEIILDSIIQAVPWAPQTVPLEVRDQPLPCRVTYFRRVRNDWSFEDVTARISDFLVDFKGDVELHCGGVIGTTTCASLLERLGDGRRLLLQPNEVAFILKGNETLVRFTPPDDPAPCMATLPMRGITRCYFADGRVQDYDARDSGMSIMRDRRRDRVLGLLGSGGDVSATPIAQDRIELIGVERSANIPSNESAKDPRRQIRVDIAVGNSNVTLDEDPHDGPTEEIVFERGVTPLGPDNRPEA